MVYFEGFTARFEPEWPSNAKVEISGGAAEKTNIKRIRPIL